jgi:hypothetical protein
MEASKGPDSLSLLRALLAMEGSVVHEAFVRLGLDPLDLRKTLGQRKKELGDALDNETWIVEKATRRSKEEGFPLATDHLLEVIWDEDSEGARWLSTMIDPDALEVALNESRYPEDGVDPRQDVPWGPVRGPVIAAESALEPPDSH